MNVVKPKEKPKTLTQRVAILEAQVAALMAQQGQPITRPENPANRNVIRQLRSELAGERKERIALAKKVKRGGS